ncbi:hypothetical protein HGRIS_009825 [Hohenbuehelia grisea]|uniref:Uncharacterized protein n=1 Tax=Hohenbuehelia grisea TaxID=104357 RepID=A0ABR3J2Q6_9AGAR
MVSKLDREERHVGMQNFKYAPAWDELCHIIKIHSPRAYNSLQQYLPMPSERRFRAKEARQPRFPMSICSRTFSLVADQLVSLNYGGPVALSCDDTKLFACFRLYWDAQEQAHFLIGGIDGLLRVADPDMVGEVIAQAKAKKATKVRLWCLTIPLPKVAPIIVSALPILSELDATDLYDLLMRVLDGLLEHRVQVVSYACDGTETELQVQQMLVAQAESRIVHVIPSQAQGSPDTKISIPVIRGQPVCVVQDSKHALKTFRNNLFSGARLLAFGNYTAIYENIRRIAFEPRTPLFTRDVERIDKQDDNAASRLFSSATLKYLADHHRECIGEIVYLFVFGELVDAYQNRRLAHIERIKLVLRARYYLDSWATYLEHAGYKRTQYILSREALDIARIVIDGLISLVLVYRDQVEGVFPLLPWLHSTEPCEHTFGIARQIVKDFSMLDFLYMIPKLRIQHREAVLRAQSSDPKARASGYCHTYFDTKDINLLALSTFPSNSNIEAIASQASHEADSLIMLLGLDHTTLHDEGPEASLPAIGAWFHDDAASPLSSDDDGEVSEDEAGNEADELLALIEREEDHTLSRTQAQENATLNLTCTSFAVLAEDMMKIQLMAEPDDEAIAELDAEEYQYICYTTKAIADLKCPVERSRPFGLGTLTVDELNFEEMVQMREQHETRQARLGIRSRKNRSGSEDHEKQKSLRRDIIRGFHDTLRETESNSVAVGTGVTRKARWEEHTPSGNAANAAAAAASVHQKIASRRKNAFSSSFTTDLLLQDLISARLRHPRAGTLGQGNLAQV